MLTWLERLATALVVWWSVHGGDGFTASIGASDTLCFVLNCGSDLFFSLAENWLSVLNIFYFCVYTFAKIHTYMHTAARMIHQ